MNIDETLDLGQFTGTENIYHQITIRGFKMGAMLTEGINYVCEKLGCYWLIDIVSSYQYLKKLKEAPFQIWKLEVNDKKEAVVTCREDTNEQPIVSQSIPFTDFPEGIFEFYYINKVCMLKSEY